MDVSAELNVNAGADAKFFDLFDEGVSVPIFDKVFEIFQVGVFLFDFMGGHGVRC